MTYRLGFDIGGTFTDLVLVDNETGDVHREKVPTTPTAFWRGAIEGVRRLCESAGVDPNEVTHLSHGSTIATNALIERAGATTGVLTTKGFRDVLAIGREKRTQIYDLSPLKPPTFAERRHRRDLPERVTAEGEVIDGLDEEATIEAIRDLESMGVESVAVSLLHAYRFPDHERRVAELIREHSTMDVSTSSRVMGELNEYERTLSTTIDAYVNPLISEYVNRLTARLADVGIDETLHLMQANGGVVTPETIAGRRLRLINSGPAAGVLGAKQLAATAGYDSIITLDMGGTSTDACVVRDGETETTTNGEIEGIPLLFPQIDIRSIGTGGGSIARLDKASVLKVGPQSAGARPGPACYGRGGTEPTVTDACVHLGYLNPENFLGGEMTLDIEAAEGVLGPLANDLEIGTTDLAAGIYEIVTTDMTGGIRQVTVEKGHDPREFTLVCYGGAGPLFANALARELGIGRVLVPPASGILSAFGLVTADRKFDFSRSQPLVIRPDNLSTMNGILSELAQKAAGISDDLERHWSVDLRYHGQTFDLSIDLPTDELDSADLSTLTERFESTYETIYGVKNENDPIEAVTWRLTGIDPIQGVVPTMADGGADLEKAARGTRLAYDGDEFDDFTIYSRYELPAGPVISGPAIVEEAESTTVIGRETTFHVDDIGNLVLEINQ